MTKAATNGLADKIRQERSRKTTEPIPQELYEHFKLQYKTGDYTAMAQTMGGNRDTYSDALSTGTATKAVLKKLKKYYGTPVTKAA